MSGLQIQAKRERALVSAADAVLRPLAWGRRSTTGTPAPVGRVLLLRLERIGDLLMTLEAIAAARTAWPAAEIDLAVGSWNLPLARLIPGLTQVHTADVPWLAREGAGDTWPTLFTKARAWAQRRYDVVVNFEPDIRSNMLAWLCGAPRRAGYWTGGGGALLTSAVEFEPAAHTAVNAVRLIHIAAGRPALAADASAFQLPAARLAVPDEAKAQAHGLLGGLNRPWVGVHVSGGRLSKQWHLDRFADVARRLARDRGASIILTGSDADRQMVGEVAAMLQGVPVLNTAGALDLAGLAGLLAAMDLLVTSDTGPMHLASAVGTPVVALFGPADPKRYGPRSPHQRVIRIDLWCSPCGQVRLPPERCRGHIPDCMNGIQADAVVQAAMDLLDTTTSPTRTGA